eukprot:contig_9319_g2229
MLIFDRYRDQNGNIERHKARNVAKGFPHVAGRAFTEKWAPVVRQTTMRTLLALVAANDWHMQQMNFKTAFLNGTLKEELYVRQPPGFERGDPSRLCRLVKAIYGLKQAAREWHLAFITALIGAGYRRSEADPCQLVQRDGARAVYILIYVYDLLLVGHSAAAVAAAKDVVAGHFKARDMGDPAWFLGMHIARDRAAGTLTLSQNQYAKTIVERYGLGSANPTTLPMLVGAKMRKEGTLLDGDAKRRYPEVIGALILSGVDPHEAVAQRRVAQIQAQCLCLGL